MSCIQQLQSLVTNLKGRFKDNQLDINGAEMTTLIQLADHAVVMNDAMIEALEAVKKERDIAHKALKPFAIIGEQLQNSMVNRSQNILFGIDNQQITYEDLEHAAKAWSESRPQLVRILEQKEAV